MGFHIIRRGGGAKVTLLIQDLPCTILVSILLNTSNVKHTINNKKYTGNKCMGIGKAVLSSNQI